MFTRLAIHAIAPTPRWPWCIGQAFQIWEKRTHWHLMRIARPFGPASRRRVEQRRPVQGGRASRRTPAFSRCGSDDATPGGRPWRECQQSQPFSSVGGNPDVAQGVSSVRRSARSSDRLHHRRRRRVRVCPSFVSVEFAFRSMAVGTDRFIRTRIPFRSVPCLVAIAVIAPAKSVSRVVATHGEELQPGRNFRGRAPSASRSVPAGRLARPRRAGTRARDGTPSQGRSINCGGWSDIDLAGGEVWWRAQHEKTGRR